MLLAITAMSLVSNFRTNVIMFIFALLASFFVFFRKKIKSIVKIVILITIIAIMLDKMMNSFFGFSFYDRLLLKNQTEDVQTIRSREEHIIRSSEMGFSRPFFGVGLGNYYEYLPIQTKTSNSLFRWKSKEAEMAATDPHNILAQVLAETGIISLLFYVSMLIGFVVGDSKKIFDKEKNSVISYKKATIVAFWTLFVYSFFNPSTTLTHNVLFWLLRVLI
jgi:hypothetical protein